MKPVYTGHPSLARVVFLSLSAEKNNLIINGLIEFAITVTVGRFFWYFVDFIQGIIDRYEINKVK